MSEISSLSRSLPVEFDVRLGQAAVRTLDTHAVAPKAPDRPERGIVQSVQNLGSNAVSFVGGAVGAYWDASPNLQKLALVPAKLAYDALQFGKPITPKTEYQHTLANMPGAVDTARDALIGMVYGKLQTADAIMSTVDAALFTATSKMARVAPRTPMQLAQRQQTEDRVAAGVDIAKQTAHKVLSISIFERHPVEFATLGASITALGTIKKQKAPGPLKVNDSEIAAASVVTGKGNNLTIDFGEQGVADYNAKNQRLVVPTVYWQERPVNTTGLVLNGRSLPVEVIRGRVGIHDVNHRGNSIAGALHPDSAFAASMLKYTFQTNPNDVWYPAMLYGLHTNLASQPLGMMAAPFVVSDVRFVGRRTAGVMEVDMLRMPPRTNVSNAYLEHSDKLITESTQQVLEALTTEMFKGKTRS